VNRSTFQVEALLNGIGQAENCLLPDKGVAPPGCHHSRNQSK
jgi:hypothetical protein